MAVFQPQPEGPGQSFALQRAHSLMQVHYWSLIRALQVKKLIPAVLDKIVSAAPGSRKPARARSLTTGLLAVMLVVLLTEFDLNLKQNSITRQTLLPLWNSSLAPLIDQLGFTNSITILPAEDTSGPPASVGAVSARVTRIIDGDTIEVVVNGREERVRYIGVNTPERDEPCAEQATRANRQLLDNRSVLLVGDNTDRDTYGRLLRYVYADGVLVERELVRSGYAESVLYRNDDRHFSEFRRLERAAAEMNIGCHPTGIFDDGDDRR